MVFIIVSKDKKTGGHSIGLAETDYPIPVGGDICRVIPVGAGQSAPAPKAVRPSRFLHSGQGVQ